MPSKSAKQHRFMQAIAHSPSFAKKAGVSQSVGKDFSAADKGKTFKKGDMMKKRYDTGGGVDFDADDDPESQKVFRDDDAGGLTELSDEERMPRRSASAPRKASTATARSAAPSLAASSSSTVTPTQKRHLQARESEQRISKREADEDKKIDYTDRVDDRNKVSGSYRRVSEEAKSGAKGRDMTDREKVVAAAVSMIPAVRGAKAVYGAGQIARLMARNSRSGVGRTAKAQELTAKEVAAANRIRSRQDMFGSGANARKYAESGGMKKGGSIMESKKMMEKKMMGGGMAYAKGGGIESRGKTKGTVIRMAAGGSVSARADGIAQRGKTKFKNY
jgi:hypothetical protein